ncbi:MAG: NUDIX hydrolase [Stackebrandtia sp.]
MLKTMRVGAYGVLSDAAGRTLLRRPLDSWRLPGATVEHGEQPADTVVRAFAEQTGLEVKTTRARKACAVTIDASEDHREHNTLLVYEVEATGGEMRDENHWLRLPELDGEPVGPITAAMLDIDSSEPAKADPIPASRAVPGRRQRVGVYAWITDPQGRVLITLIADGFSSAGKWHLPGGGLDFGEQPSESLLREIVEETSQDAELLGLRTVDSRHTPNDVNAAGDNEDYQGIHIIYDAAVAEAKPLEIQDIGGSTGEARWMTLDELSTLPITPAVEAALQHWDGRVDRWIGAVPGLSAAANIEELRDEWER